MSAAGLLVAALIVPGLGSVGAGGAAGPAAASDVRGDDRLQLESVVAIVARGHAFLARQQNVDGSFSIVRNESGNAAPVAVTALAALSFMAAGHLPDRGEYTARVRHAIDWLVERCRHDGYITTDADTTSRMHGQGYALLALTQAWGMEGGDDARRARLRSAIVRGVGLIETTQGETGGWYYEPRATQNHESSITVCMIQALRAARDAGFAVNRDVIRRAEAYVAASQNEVDGRFRYMLNDPRTSWALTAAAISTLNATGDYGSERLELGFSALQQADPFTGGGRFEAFQDYGALYAAQAYWSWRDPAAFGRWWPAFVTSCAERQRPDGSFFDGEYGHVYATAIVTLTLQVPLGYLPLFRR